MDYFVLLETISIEGYDLLKGGNWLWENLLL